MWLMIFLLAVYVMPDIKSFFYRLLVSVFTVLSFLFSFLFNDYPCGSLHISFSGAVPECKISCWIGVSFTIPVQCLRVFQSPYEDPASPARFKVD